MESNLVSRTIPFDASFGCPGPGRDQPFVQLPYPNVFEEVAAFFADIQSHAGKFFDETLFGDKAFDILQSKIDDQPLVGDARFGRDLQIEPRANAAHDEGQE